MATVDWYQQGKGFPGKGSSLGTRHGERKIGGILGRGEIREEASTSGTEQEMQSHGDLGCPQFTMLLLTLPVGFQGGV